MYCKKCKYHAFDHVGTCPKCGLEWEETRKALYLNWLTSRGHDWFATPTAQAQPAVTETIAPPPRAAQPANQASQGEYLNLEQPVAPTPLEGLEVAFLPDLDFGLEEPEATTVQAPAPTPKPAPAKAPTPPKPAPPAPDLFLGDTSSEDLVELDFSLSMDPPPSPAPKAAPPRREDLFIPELEEMLAPLTEEPKAPSSGKTAPGKAPKKAAVEDDIYLDFSTDHKPAQAKPDIAELDLLDFDIKK